MNDNTQKALVHSSLEALKRSTLNVLYEARDKVPLEQDEVRERLGIPKIDYRSNTRSARHNSLIFGILMHLKDDGYAYLKSRSGWQITKQGISLIED